MTLVEPPTLSPSTAAHHLGFGGWLKVEPAEYAVAVLGHLAVSAAGGEGRAGRLASLARPFTGSLLAVGVESSELEQFLASLARRDGQWRTILGDGCRGMAEDRLMLLAIDLCTHEVVPAGAADPLARLRRLDAVLDILDVPAAAAVVEEHYALTLEDLLAPTGTAFDVAAAARAARPGANLLSYVHPVLGHAATFGLNRLAVDKKVDAPPVPTFVAELTRAITAVQAAFEGAEQVEHADRIHDTLLTRLREDRDADTAAAFARAVALLEQIDGVTSTAPDQIPDLTGRGLAEARQIITSLGLRCDVADDLRPGGTARFVLSDANWVIANQTGPVAGKVTLAVRKRSDPTR